MLVTRVIGTKIRRRAEHLDDQARAPAAAASDAESTTTRSRTLPDLVAVGVEDDMPARRATKTRRAAHERQATGGDRVGPVARGRRPGAAVRVHEVSRRTRLRCAAALAAPALAAALLAGCSSEGAASAGSGTPAATAGSAAAGGDNGVADEDADAILAAAQKGLADAESFRVRGAGAAGTSGSPSTWASSPAAAPRHGRVSGQEFGLLVTGGKTYVKATGDFLAARGVPKELTSCSRASGCCSRPTASDRFREFTDGKASATRSSTPTARSTKGEQKDVDGVAAIALVSKGGSPDSGGTLWVATEGRRGRCASSRGRAPRPRAPWRSRTTSTWTSSRRARTTSSTSARSPAAAGCRAGPPAEPALAGDDVRRTQGVAAVWPARSDVVLLGVAVLGVSASAPLIVAIAAPAFAIAFWRNALGGVVLLGATLLGPGRAALRLSSGERRTVGLAAGYLAVHFATWVPSVTMTSVASSTALVATQPVWNAVIAQRRGELVPPRAWLGIGVALAGVLLVTGVDVSVSGRAVLGDVLALSGGVAAALYVEQGATARRSLGTSAYSGLVFTGCALLLLAACAVGRVPVVGFPPAVWAGLVALTVSAQLVGHTLVNRALRTVAPVVVALAILLEPPGATAIAALWLGQVPPFVVLPAAVLVLAGVGLVVGARSGRPDPPAVD